MLCCPIEGTTDLGIFFQNRYGVGDVGQCVQRTVERSRAGAALQRARDKTVACGLEG